MEHSKKIREIFTDFVCNLIDCKKASITFKTNYSIRCKLLQSKQLFRSLYKAYKTFRHLVCLSCAQEITQKSSDITLYLRESFWCISKHQRTY